MNESLSNPAVSVIIPAYNAGRWIAETLDSVLAQTYRHTEVIIVDDGSTDQTPQIIAAYGSQVRCLRQENKGQSAALNVGICAARGAYIALIDADDLWMPEKLELQIRLLSNEPDLAWVYSDAVILEGQVDRYNIGRFAKLHAGDVLRPLLLGNFIASPTPVMRRNVFDTVGYFDESLLLRVPRDWDMWLRIAARYQVKVVNKPLAKVRRHATSMTGTMDLEYNYRSKLTVVENAIARDPERLADLREHAIANVCIAIGQSMVKRGDRVGAREMFARAIRLYPYDVRALGYWLATLLPLPFLNRLIIVRRSLIGMGSQVESGRLGEKAR